MESTLSSPCSALIHLSLAKVRLSLSLTLSHLMIWCSGQTALFLFLLTKMALAYLPTALSVALRPLSPFQQAQYAQVFLLKPAPFCKLFAGLGSINKSSTSLLLLLLSDSRSVVATFVSNSVFLFTSISLADLAGTAFFLPLFCQTTMGPRTLVSSGVRRS